MVQIQGVTLSSTGEPVFRQCGCKIMTHYGWKAVFKIIIIIILCWQINWLYSTSQAKSTFTCVCVTDMSCHLHIDLLLHTILVIIQMYLKCLLQTCQTGFLLVDRGIIHIHVTTRKWNAMFKKCKMDVCTWKTQKKNWKWRMDCVIPWTKCFVMQNTVYYQRENE